MANPDASRARLREIIDQYKEFVDKRGAASESDTRAKIITRVLTDVLKWPESDMDREVHTETGRLDYRMRVLGKPLIVVEAKPEGTAFNIPVDGSRKAYALDGALVSDEETKKAIHQVRTYCDEESIRYAIATNGDAWIVFRAVRDDNVGWKKGHARVFKSLERIHAEFTDFWNFLSFEAISSGSLNAEFSSTLRTSRQLHRVIAKLFNADLPLERNRLNTDLQPLVKLVFEDIADQETLDVLNECYIHTGTLKSVANDLDNVITELIPKFLIDAGTQPIGADHDRGGFLRTVKDSVNVSKGELFLLLGGIGSGKSTFLKRYQRTTGRALLVERTLWFSVDFIRPPELADMEDFVWRKILDTIRTRYKHHDCEKRKYLKEVFAQDIEALNATALNGFPQGKQKYEDALSPYLYEWTKNLARYVPRLVQNACTRLRLKPVIFIDNVDQLSPEYQSDIFLFAQTVTGLVSSITVVALREESYYSAKLRKTFTAYKSRKFHIASPLFKKMILNRIEFAIRSLEKQREGDVLTPVEKNKRHDMSEFLTLVKGSIVDNVRIGRFIKSLCYGNMRFALEMFCTFLTSGATDVDKMLKIKRRDGWYDIAYHEFVKAIMLDERAYYKEEPSPIFNMFNVGTEPNSSHFTAWRIIRSLTAHRGTSTTEGIGYVELSRILVTFENTFDNVEDFVATMNRLVVAHLVEPNTRSTVSVEGASHVRVTSAGWYYTRYLVPTFAYLDLVLQDTPFNDAALEKVLRQSVYDVNNLADSEDHKLERIRARFNRVERFLNYLEDEEKREREQVGLDRIDDPIAEPIVSWIRSQFEEERNWIDRRLRENRERYREEYVAPVYADEEELLGLNDVEVEDQAPEAAS